MDVVILGAAMPFGPDTLKFKSLGGSETAQLMLGKELAKRGHRVTQVTALPPPGEPDFIPNATTAPDGVTYVSIEFWQKVVCEMRHDLLIISRNMQFANVPHQARHAVFWAHDLATHTFMAPALSTYGWNIDEVWAVSETHADQIHSITGYPRARIVAMRNGIVDVRDDKVVVPVLAPQPRDPKALIYAARPERGLEALLRPGGIMEQLPEFTLRLSMYAHFPEHMKPLYDWCQERVKALPNVEYLGSLNQPQMRDEIGRAAAYVYPTQFEETSCILARECIEQGTPMLTNRVGALPETLGDCGMFLEQWRIEDFPHSYQKSSLQWNSDEYCREFAKMVRSYLTSDLMKPFRERREKAMAERTDLYWDEVAAAAEARIGAYRTNKAFSVVRSLVEDGDAIAALHLIKQVEAKNPRLPPALQTYFGFIVEKYRFVDFDEKQMGAYYEEATKHWTKEYPNAHQADPVNEAVAGQARHAWVAQQIRDAKLEDGSVVFEYGVAEGNLILNLAKQFPNLQFIGCDFDDLALEKALEYAKKHQIENVYLFNSLNESTQRKADVVVCCEVLEHVRYPWLHLDKLERQAKPGALMLLSTPFGGWEAMQWSHFGHDHFRQHIWEFSEADYQEMIGHKANLKVQQVSAQHAADMRVLGHFCIRYNADQGVDEPRPPREIDLDRKIALHHPRQSVTACIIAKDSDKTIARTLDSLRFTVHAVHVAIDENTQDATAARVREFAEKHPWIPVYIRHIPSIKPRQFGFDDARNASLDGLVTDWVLWLDTDEYLSKPLLRFIRSNAARSYAIHQHHFTVEPRGVPMQIDRPARLCRWDLKFYGKVHEHAEIGYNEGPGWGILLPDVDIGHIGYVDETVRRLRFERNFPFLEWDREVNPDRKLGSYLWFRDILHRMRYAMEANNTPAVFAIAEEAVRFYNENIEQIMAFGLGIEQALGYLSEAHRVLQRGRTVTIQATLDGQPVAFGGIITDVEQILRPLKRILGPEIEKANSRYWR